MPYLTTPPTAPAQPLSRRAWLARSAAACVGVPALWQLSGCATAPVFEAPPASVSVRPLRAGQEFRLQGTNLYNDLGIGSGRYVVREITPSTRLIDVSLPSSNIHRQDDSQRQGRLLLAGDSHLSEELFYDIPYRFERPTRWLPDQLQLGRSPLEHNRYQPEGEFFWLRWQSQVTGVGWERIRVPAGEFLALRVERNIWFDHPDRWRLNNSRQETLWFAPTLGFWVRREWTGHYYLPGPRPARMEDDWVRFELTSA